MAQFIELEANSRSIKRRSPVYGVGVNDAKYMTAGTFNNKRLICPYFNTWKNMLRRCYSSTKQENPTYINCFVCDEWLTFSNFKSWMQKQDRQSKHLDKDLLIQGNKEYSPRACVFVDRKINNLITTKKSKQGLPVGVAKHKNKYTANAKNYDGEKVYLGLYETEIDAHNAYKMFKYSVIKRVAKGVCEPLRSALMSYKIQGD